MGATGKGAVITLVERTSRFVLLAPLPTRHTAVLTRDELTRMILQLPTALRRTLTWDRGNEMAYHAEFSINTRVISTSATRTVPGNAARTRTPTVFYASTGPKAPTYATSPNKTATTSPTGSTPDHDKPSDGRLPPKRSNEPLLQPPVETKGQSNSACAVRDGP
jgi:hypothetical protein